MKKEKVQMGSNGESIFISYNYDTALNIAQDVAETLKEMGFDPWWLKDPVHSSLLKVIVDNALRNCYRAIVIWTTPKLSAWQQLEVHFMQGLLQDGLHSRDMFIVTRAKDLAGKTDSYLEFLEAAEYVDWHDRPSTALSHLVNSRLGPLLLNLPREVKPNFDSFFKCGPLRPNGTGLYSFSGHFRDLEGKKTTYTSADAPNRFHWLFLKDKWNYFIQHPRPTITHNSRWHVGNVRIGTNVKQVHLAVAENADSHEWAKQCIMRGDFSGIDPSLFKDNFSTVDTIEVSGT